MKREWFRIGVGLSVISAHALCFFIIMFGKEDYLSESQRIETALLFMPITAAYVTAIIRSAIERQQIHIFESRININYASIIIVITMLMLIGLLYTVLSLDGINESDRQRILLFEVVFGGSFGLLASDLFGRVEN